MEFEEEENRKKKNQNNILSTCNDIGLLWCKKYIPTIHYDAHSVCSAYIFYNLTSTNNEIETANRFERTEQRPHIPAYRLYTTGSKKMPLIMEKKMKTINVFARTVTVYEAV